MKRVFLSITMENQRNFCKQKSFIFRVLTLVFMVIVIASCQKTDDKEKEEEVVNNRGIIANDASEITKKLAEEHLAGANYEYLLAPSINYNEFKTFYTNLIACGTTIGSYSENKSELTDNQFYFIVGAFNQISGQFYRCSEASIIVEKNSKTNKYYIIRYAMISSD